MNENDMISSVLSMSDMSQPFSVENPAPRRREVAIPLPPGGRGRNASTKSSIFTFFIAFSSVFWLSGGSSTAQLPAADSDPPKIVAQDTPVYKLVRAKLDPDVKSVAWTAFGADLEDADGDQNGNRFSFTGAPGRYRIQAFYTTESGQQGIAAKVVTITGAPLPPGPGPNPGPEPGPTPDPGPGPPGPNPPVITGKIHVLYVYNPGVTDQQHLSVDQSLKDGLVSLQAVWHPRPKDHPELAQKGLSSAVNAVGVPCLIFQDERGKVIKVPGQSRQAYPLRGTSLPPTKPEEIIALVKQLRGVK